MKSIVFGCQTLLVALAVFDSQKSTLQSRLYSKTIFLLDKEMEKSCFGKWSDKKIELAN